MSSKSRANGSQWLHQTPMQSIDKWIDPQLGAEVSLREQESNGGKVAKLALSIDIYVSVVIALKDGEGARWLGDAHRQSVSKRIRVQVRAQ